MGENMGLSSATEWHLECDGCGHMSVVRKSWEFVEQETKWVSGTVDLAVMARAKHWLACGKACIADAVLSVLPPEVREVKANA